MSELRLYAVGIDEVRDMFGAHPALAARLTAIADARWFAQPRERRGVLHLLGPLTRRPILPPVGPEDPTRDDVDALLTGRYVAPERTLPAWRVVESWLATLAWGSLVLPASAAEVDQLDFDLAAAGVPAELAVDALLRRDARVPLRPLPGMRVGYARHPQVLAMRDALRRVRGDVAVRSQGTVDRLDDWWADLPTWAERATLEGRPAPDVVALWLA